MRIARTLKVVVWGLAISGLAFADAAKRIEVPAGDLLAAIELIAKDADVEIVYQPEKLKGIRTAGLSGEFTTQEAVTKLIKGTQLRLSTDPVTGAMLIALSESAAIGALAEKDVDGLGGSLQFAQRESATSEPSTRQTAEASSSLDESAQDARKDRTEIETILVTARKRGEERLQDVPVAVTAISASSLVNSNQSRLQDYFTSIPGLSLTTGNHGAAMVSIRGIKMEEWEYSGATVGIMVDGVPVTLVAGEGSLTAPDIDPSSLQRVEVLRGPQGTLFGASSLGGLINYVTAEPSMERVSGRLSAGTTSVAHGDDLGYSLRGAVNVPLNDQLAVRASGFTRRDPGYIDNFYFGEPGAMATDVNDSEAYGGHLTVLWRPSETFSLKLSALMQRFSANGVDYAILDPAFGDLEQSFFRGTGTMVRESQAYSAALSVRLGNGELTSLTGLGTNPFKSNYDLTPVLDWLGPLLFPGTNAIGSPQINNQHTLDKFSQEVRYSAPLGKRWEYMLAGFYTRERFAIFAPNPRIDPITRESPGFGFLQRGRDELEEYAAFASLTFNLSERFDFQVGGRQSRYRRQGSGAISGVVFCPAPWGDPACEPYARGEVWLGGEGTPLRDSAFTYHLTSRFKISPDLMVYGRLATGYRLGGGTSDAPPDAFCVLNNFPCKVDPDTTQNYEIGAKGELFAGMLSFDTSIYYIDWKDIPLVVFPFANNPNIAYVDNSGRATSKGVELSLQFRPRSGLTLGGWLAWSNAYLAEPALDVGFHAVGRDHLPLSSRFSGQFSAEQEFPVGDRMTAFLGASVTHAGRRFGVFRQLAEASNNERQIFPAYTKTDVRAGVRYDDWTVNLFINNITDKRAAISGGLGSSLGANYFTSIRPRTIGLGVERSF